MLPRKYRLQKEKDILRVIRYGRILRAGPFSLRMLTNNQPFSRLTIIIGKEVGKRSTRRNRLKRVIRAALREFLLNIKPGFDVVIRLHQYLPKATAATVHQELVQLFVKARLL